MDTRRDLIKKLAVGAAAVTAALPTTRAHAASFTAALHPGSDPAWLIAPLARGSAIGHGWTIASLSSPERGAVILRLVHESLSPVQVHLCAHRGSPRGVVSSHFLDFIVMDGGQGDRPTQESLGRALMVLAKTVRANELRTQADPALLGSLLTHGERIDRFGPETL